MGEKATFRFVVAIIVTLMLGLFSLIFLPNKYAFDIFGIIMLVFIGIVSFFIITFCIYCSRRKKNKIEKTISRYFLNVLSDERNNMFVYKKFCEEGCMYMFQYINKSGKKFFVAKKLSYIKVQELENSDKPYIEKVENIYIPKKGSIVDYLHYNESIERENKDRYILHINKDMIFSDAVNL